jgi:hypothetical protein
MVSEGQLYSEKSKDRLFLVQEKLDKEVSYTIALNDEKKSNIKKLSLWSVYYNDTNQFAEMFESEIEAQKLIS